MSMPNPVPASHHHGPTIARWRLPTVRVRQEGGVVIVEQRVPARVSNIKVSTTTNDSGNIQTLRAYYYESGLGSDSRLPLVRERLTVPASIAGPEQIEQAVKAAIATYDPGTAAPGRRWGPGMWSGLAMVGFGVVFFVIAFFFLRIATRVIRLDEEAYGRSFDYDSLILLLPAGFTVLGVLIMVIGLRSAWILRTPDFVAEEQWQLLRSILTRMTGQQPGSSRPLDVEAGLRPDLITHPHGETRRRGVTLDGRMGPAWPDAYSVTRTVRRGRFKVLLTLSLIIVITSLMYVFSKGGASLSAGQAITAILVSTGMVGAALMPPLQTCDRLLAAYPTQVPGEDAPRRIGLRDVDVDNLPGWCAARLRQDYWNAASAGFWVLCAAGGVLLFIQRNSEHSTDASAVSALFLSIPVYIGLTMLAVATTVVVSVVWARNRDAGRRRLVGLA
jgi:hypothetical protein avisC_09406